MEKIVIFAGTTEGRKLSEALGNAGIPHTVCVATDYGEEVLKEEPCPLAEVRKGRMTAEQMGPFLEEGGFTTVVDATHPYAQIVTANIKAAANAAGVRYLRLLREMDGAEEDGALMPQMRYFENTKECAEGLRDSEGNILLTTGSKELAVFAETEGLRDRLIARVLPGTESIGLCEKSGIPGKRIIAMQGPFSEDMNLALIRQFDVKILVTKMSGRTGGYGEKLSAAAKSGIPVWIIGRPAEENGLSFKEVLRALGVFCEDTECAGVKEECGAKEAASGAEEADRSHEAAENALAVPGVRFRITLAGIGMGDPGSMTVACAEAIRGADILFGASRMIAPYTPRMEKQPFYLARDILPYLKEKQAGGTLCGEISVVVLFSGDSGFFSGCEKMYHALKDAAENGDLNADVRILPGISSISTLASRTGVPYGNAAVLSLHGKKNWEEELLAAIRKRRYAFMLTSGREDLAAIGKLLRDNGFENASVTYGFAMGSAEETLRTLSIRECLEGETADAPGQGLYTCLIDNPDAGAGTAGETGVGNKSAGETEAGGETTAERTALPLTHGLPDDAFMRGKVPMTKEEVRETVISKLRLTEGSVVYDVGAGTGSIAIEIARRAAAQEYSRGGDEAGKTKVYAIEQNPDGIALIRENAARLGAKGLMVVEGKAPDALEELPAPTHVFIGGSSGGLRDILQLIYGKNPSARIVLTAVTLETVAEMSEVAGAFPHTEEEFVTISAARSRKAGRYHLMTAENPVWICAFTMCPEAED